MDLKGQRKLPLFIWQHRDTVLRRRDDCSTRRVEPLLRLRRALMTAAVTLSVSRAAHTLRLNGAPAFARRYAITRRRGLRSQIEFSRVGAGGPSTIVSHPHVRCAPFQIRRAASRRAAPAPADSRMIRWQRVRDRRNSSPPRGDLACCCLRTAWPETACHRKKTAASGREPRSSSCRRGVFIRRRRRRARTCRPCRRAPRSRRRWRSSPSGACRSCPRRRSTARGSRPSNIRSRASRRNWRARRR